MYRRNTLIVDKIIKKFFKKTIPLRCTQRVLYRERERERVQGLIKIMWTLIKYWLPAVTRRVSVIIKETSLFPSIFNKQTRPRAGVPCAIRINRKRKKDICNREIPRKSQTYLLLLYRFHGKAFACSCVSERVLFSLLKGQRNPTISSHLENINELPADDDVRQCTYRYVRTHSV